MSSIDITMTGAAGAAPTPAAVALGAVFLQAPTAAPFQGTGLPCSGTPAVVRPWASSPAGGRFAAEHGADYAQRTTSSTPGAQPPRDPLS